MYKVTVFSGGEKKKLEARHEEKTKRGALARVAQYLHRTIFKVGKHYILHI